MNSELPKEVAVEVVYSAAVQRGFGPAFWHSMFDHLVRSRELTWRFFLRNFSARYRQSLFGYLWAILPTLVTVLAFSYLKESKILSIGKTKIPYPLFILVGLTVWQIVATGLTKMSQSLVGAGTLLVKINFPRESLVLASLIESFVDTLIRCLLVVAFCLWYGFVPAWQILLVPLVLIPLVLLTLGLGFVLSIANAVFRDIGNGITLFFTFAMFLAPVFYSAPQQWPKSLLNYLNPVSPFIISVRDLLLGEPLRYPGTLTITSCVCLLVFLFGWRSFNMAMPRIAERI